MEEDSRMNDTCDLETIDGRRRAGREVKLRVTSPRTMVLARTAQHHGALSLLRRLLLAAGVLGCFCGVTRQIPIDESETRGTLWEILCCKS